MPQQTLKEGLNGIVTGKSRKAPKEVPLGLHIASVSGGLGSDLKERQMSPCKANNQKSLR